MRLLAIFCLAVGAVLTAAPGTNSHPHDRRDILKDFKHFGESALNTLKDGALQAVHNLPSTLLSAGLGVGLTALFGKREAPLDVHFADLVKEEAAGVLHKVEEAIKDAQCVSQGLEQLLQEGASSLQDDDDVRQLAQKVLTFLMDSFQSLIKKGTYNVDVEKLFGNILPSAVGRLTQKQDRRFLVSSLLQGVGDTLKDVVGIAGQAVGGVQSLLSNLLTGTTPTLQSHVDNIKALATNFLSQAGTMTAQSAANAVKFFQPYADTLGPLYDRIKALASVLTPSQEPIVG